jgi:hypothetical protein
MYTLEPKCPKCGAYCAQGDLFCRKCGIRLNISPDDKDQSSPFLKEVITLLKVLKEFRSWIDMKDKKNIRFMKGYKERIVEEIGPSIQKFNERYKDREEGRSPLFNLTVDTFSWLSRPISLMETKLRPSVGMGVFLERWMMTKAAESYLKECCQEADRRLDELEKRTNEGQKNRILPSKTQELRAKQYGSFPPLARKEFIWRSSKRERPSQLKQVRDFQSKRYLWTLGSSSF